MPVGAISLLTDRRARSRPSRHPQGTDFSGEGKFLNLTGTSQEEKSSEGLPLDDGAAYGRIATSEIAIPQGINPNKETHHWHSSQRATPSWIWQHDSQNQPTNRQSDHLTCSIKQ